MACITAVWVHHVNPLPGERFILETVFRRSAEHRLIAETTGFFTGLGTPPVVLLLTAMAIGVIRRIDVKWLWMVAATVAAPLLAVALKQLGGPTIPSTEVNGPGGALSPSSLPSAHAAHAAAFFGVLAVLSLTHRRRDLALGFVLIGALVGPATVVAGAHVPSDVIAGYAVGGAWLSGIVAVGPRRLRGRRRAISS